MSDTKKLNNKIYENNYIELQKQQKLSSSLFMAFIKQLTIGMDMTKLQAPAFMIKPVSFLEAMSDTLHFPKFLFRLKSEKSELERLLIVTKYLLRGFATNTAGSFAMCKPYNPILGEQFHSEYKYKGSYSKTVFTAEQVSHHPPISSVFIKNEEEGLALVSVVKYGGKFYGNTAVNTLKGHCKLYNFYNKNNSKDEKTEVYKIKFPSLIARGIFFGTSRLELYDSLEIECEKTGYRSKITFASNSIIFGEVHDSKKQLFEIKGSLLEKATISKPTSFFGSTPTVNLFYDFTKFKLKEKLVKDINQQEENESRRVWHLITENIYNENHEKANAEKNIVENRERKKRKLGEYPEMKYFKKQNNGKMDYLCMVFDPIEFQKKLEKKKEVKKMQVDEKNLLTGLSN